MEARLELEWQSWWPDQPAPENIQGAIGSIEWTRKLIGKLGLNQPSTVGYETFPELQYLWGRKVDVSTLAELRRRFDAPGGANHRHWFVKPVDEYKLWTGQIFDTADHPYLKPFNGDTRVEIHEPVEFSEEYRGFWHRRQFTFARYPIEDEPQVIVSHRNWGAEPLIRHLELSLHDRPLVVDIGVDMYGKWMVVEISEPWSMGAYGAEAQYLNAHMAWWKTLQ